MPRGPCRSLPRSLGTWLELLDQPEREWRMVTRAHWPEQRAMRLRLTSCVHLWWRFPRDSWKNRVSEKHGREHRLLLHRALMFPWGEKCMSGWIPAPWGFRRDKGCWGRERGAVQLLCPPFPFPSLLSAPSAQPPRTGQLWNPSLSPAHPDPSRKTENPSPYKLGMPFCSSHLP